MRSAGVGRWVATALVALGGVGCEPQDTRMPLPAARAPADVLQAPSPTEPSVEPTDTATPAPAATPPPEAPPASDWWQVNPAAEPMTFATPACVQVSPPTGTRHAFACAVKRFAPDGWLMDLQYLDPQGRDAGLFKFNQGAALGGYRLSYDALGRPLHKDFYSGDPTTPPIASADWIYDAAGRLALVTGDGKYQDRPVYDTQGRLMRVEHFNVPEYISRWETYVYNSQDQLAELIYAGQDYCYAGPIDDQPGCGYFASTSYTYHPNGQLKHDHTLNIEQYDSTWDNDYDEQGRHISTSDSLNESGYTTTWSYDTQGRQVEEHVFGAGSSGSSDEWTHRLFTDAGQPGAESNSLDWELNGVSDSPGTGHRGTLNRFFYACGSGDLLFEEQDTTEDGVRDGWRELMRDEAGNLRVDRYHGSLVQGLYLSRIEYDYSCYE